MATTGTSLRMADGAVVAPHFQEYRMFPDSKRMVSAIVAKVSPEKDEEDFPERDAPEGMIAAAEDIMDVLSSYSGSPVSDSASRVEKATQEAARRAKAKMLCEALCAFFDQYDAGEGHGEEGDE